MDMGWGWQEAVAFLGAGERGVNGLAVLAVFAVPEVLAARAACLQWGNPT
ncbi:hypothetical protein ATL40_2562 [Serinibacter salmoneus]|uniref:Uncharacterized protein n=1 Tax=Serinibacter salmoneus TaxID=556530 RepID=A0A2A9D2R2_9MICO|nr:hypothetical protein ATL40_2562 [Serinibacter salmoneus]